MVNQTLIEKYQEILLKDRSSRVFAPLAEAYRKMGWLKEALSTCEQGIKLNPEFSGGYVALGKIYLDLKQLEKALSALDKAIQLNAENLLAHQLRGELQLKLKNPKEALRSYKMVLFLSPQHTRAQLAVKKLESLTAGDYEQELFEMKPLKPSSQTIEALQSPLLSPNENASAPGHFDFSQLERILSLVDAFIVRNEFQRASELLSSSRAEFNHHPEIKKRIDLLRLRSDSQIAYSPPSNKLDRKSETKTAKILKLKGLLEKLGHRALS